MLLSPLCIVPLKRVPGPGYSITICTYSITTFQFFFGGGELNPPMLSGCFLDFPVFGFWPIVVDVDVLAWGGVFFFARGVEFDPLLTFTTYKNERGSGSWVSLMQDIPPLLRTMNRELNPCRGTEPSL